MSYTLYFQAYQNGKDQELPTERIIQCFGPHVLSRDEFGCKVEYDAQNSSFIYLDMDKERCSSFSVDRPCTDERLYTSLQEVMKLGNFICLTPEGVAYMLNMNVVEHVPVEMREAIKAVI